MSRYAFLGLALAVCLSVVSPLVASAQYYSTYPAPYYGCNQTYPYNNYSNCGQPTLTCTTSYQNVVGGLQATYSAFGGTSPLYNWATPAQSYNGTGPTLTILVPYQNFGAVTVTNGTQIATCSPGTYGQGGYGYPGMVQTQPVLTMQYIPSLPNTGFAPTNFVGLVSALLLLVLAALFFFPYVRKAFAFILR